MPHRTSLLAAAVAVAVTVSACSDTPPIEGDPFPILLDRADGAFLIDLREGDSVRRAVIDVLSPLTVFDPGPNVPARRRAATFSLLGHRSDTDPSLVARARLSTTVLGLHPCASPDPAEPTPCTVGDPDAPTTIDAILGADALRGAAIRFDPSADRIAILPDIAGSGEARDRACDAEVPRPFYGGGNMLIGGTVLRFDGLRIALGVCLSHDPDATTAEQRGTDTALVLSTGIGISILGETRYEAWRRISGGPALADLPRAAALLPSGRVDGRLARIDRLAIVGTSTAPRGACREVFAHHFLTQRDCVAEDTDCPCTDEDDGCAAAAILELAPPAPIEAVVVSDEHPLLQALRAELRPDQPEIDGILGVDALATAQFDVDYPNNRLLLRCVGAGCVARPSFRESADRTNIERCLAAAPPPTTDAGVADGGPDAAPVP